MKGSKEVVDKAWAKLTAPQHSIESQHNIKPTKQQSRQRAPGFSEPLHPCPVAYLVVAKLWGKTAFIKERTPGDFVVNQPPGKNRVQELGARNQQELKAGEPGEPGILLITTIEREGRFRQTNPAENFPRIESPPPAGPKRYSTAFRQLIPEHNTFPRGKDTGTDFSKKRHAEHMFPAGNKRHADRYLAFVVGGIQQTLQCTRIRLTVRIKHPDIICIQPAESQSEAGIPPMSPLLDRNHKTGRGKICFETLFNIRANPSARQQNNEIRFAGLLHQALQTCANREKIPLARDNGTNSHHDFHYVPKRGFFKKNAE